MAHRSLLRVLACVVLVLAATPLAATTATVTTVADSGPGSLRQALLDAEAGLVDRIEFAIQTGEQTIVTQSALPEVTRSIVIDGKTQPGYTGKPIIAIDGGFRPHPSDGLQLEGGEVYGLVIYGFTTAITVGRLGGIVQNCFIGTDLSGTRVAGNASQSWIKETIGIDARTEGAIIIGGSIPGEGNLITGPYYGVRIRDGGNYSIQGNEFGNARWTAFHIDIQDHDRGSIAIGGEAPNVFAGNFTTSGVRLFQSSAVTIEGNYFAGGEAPEITLFLMYAVIIDSSHANLIHDNLIGYCKGVLITGESLQNRVLGNRFRSTAEILLSERDPLAWPAPNDPGDRDSGPNGLINSPVITNVALQGTMAVITGVLSTHPNRTHRVELFSSSHCLIYTGHGPGHTFLGALDVTTDANGAASFSYTASVTVGNVITATATSDEEGTSEFSNCFNVAREHPGTFSLSAAEMNGREGQSLILEIRRRSGAGGPVNFKFEIAGTATLGSDFWTHSGLLGFNDGETTQTMPVQIFQDAEPETDESIIVKLTDLTNGAILGSPSTTTILIVDEDVRAAVSVRSTSVKEGNAGVTSISVPVSLRTAAQKSLSLPYSCRSGTAKPGSDYADCSGIVTFEAGSTTASISVSVLGDEEGEWTEYFELVVGGLEPVLGTVWILNDDNAVVAFEDAILLERDGEWTAQLTIRGDRPLWGSASWCAEGVTADSRDYASKSWSNVEFNGETVKTVPITIFGDLTPEADETFQVRFYDSSGPLEFTPNPATITILNDDVRIDPMLMRVAAGTSDPVTIELANDSPEDWLFTAASSNPGAVSVPPTVLLRAGTHRTELPVTALVPDQRATIAVTLPQRRGGRTHSVAVRTYTKTILRFTPSRLQLHPGGTETVSVSLDPAAPHATVIGLTAVGPVRLPSTLTIPAGGAATFQVTASGPGTFTIDARLPTEYDDEVQSLFGEVVDAPETPKIFELAPGHGPASGGTEVTLNGEFLRADCNVAFGGSPAPAVTFVSAAKLLATTPPHAPGLTDVLLTCGTDSFTLSDGFVYIYEPPHASNVVPSAGTIHGGTFVRVEGSHFDGSCWVFFGGSAAPEGIVRNAEIIDALTPLHRAATVDVTVRCSGGGTSIPAAYTYCDADDPAPLITGITPTAAAPGELVTIAGVYFRPSDTVTFDAAPASIVDSAPQSVVVRVPELAPSDVSVHITDASGRGTALGPRFTVRTARPPRVDSVAPQAVPAGGEIALSGDAFRPEFTFEVGGHTADILVLDLEHATVRVSDELEPGSYPLNVRDAGGTIAATGPAVEILADGITIASVHPRCATTDGGIYTTIRGSGFVPGATATWNGAPATAVEVIDARTLRALVPPGNAGRARIAVADPSGRTATLTNGFTYESPFDPHACSGRARASRH